jgi:hypothetical protein
VAIWYILWQFGIFCGHLVHFVAIWYILWPFGIFCGHLVCFSRFGMFYQEKSGNPGSSHGPNYIAGECLLTLAQTKQLMSSYGFCILKYFYHATSKQRFFFNFF